MRRCALSTLVGFTLLVGAAPAQDEKKDAPKNDVLKKEMDLLQGAWSAVAAERDGEKAPAERLKMLKLVFKDDTITLRMPAKYKLDPAKTPRTIDVMPTEGTDKEKTIEGIYELKDDELKLCVAQPGNPRPTEFSSKPGSGVAFLVFKKDKAGK